MGCHSAGAILHLQVSVAKQLVEVWHLMHSQPDAEMLNVSVRNTAEREVECLGYF